MNSSPDAGTSYENKYEILDDIATDSDLSFRWEQSLGLEGVIRSLEEGDKESIAHHFADLLDSLNLTYQGYEFYADILVALNRKGSSYGYRKNT